MKGTSWNSVTSAAGKIPEPNADNSDDIKYTVNADNSDDIEYTAETLDKSGKPNDSNVRGKNKQGYKNWGS